MASTPKDVTDVMCSFMAQLYPTPQTVTNRVGLDGLLSIFSSARARRALLPCLGHIFQPRPDAVEKIASVKLFPWLLRAGRVLNSLAVNSLSSATSTVHSGSDNQSSVYQRRSHQELSLTCSCAHHARRSAAPISWAGGPP